MVLDPATLPHIRPYRDEDAEGVATMWNDSESEWPGGWDGTPHTAERVRREHAEERLIETYLAFADGQVAGYCSLGNDNNDPQAAWIPLLNVSPQFQGRGLGRDLLKRALAHTCELGYQRLSLGTWAGNMKSIPLYKKTGFFWAPDTSVTMHNFLPLLFALQPVQEFLDGADWYATQVRDLSASPDKEKRGKIEVFTYVWRRDGRELRATIDHRARGLMALETDEWAISCALDEPAVPLGGRRTTPVGGTAQAGRLTAGDAGGRGRYGPEHVVPSAGRGARATGLDAAGRRREHCRHEEERQQISTGPHDGHHRGGGRAAGRGRATNQAGGRGARRAFLARAGGAADRPG